MYIFIFRFVAADRYAAAELRALGPRFLFPRNHMTAIHTMQGVQDLLEVFGDKVQLTPKGVLGFLNKGLKGTKTIPFTSIQAL